MRLRRRARPGAGGLLLVLAGAACGDRPADGAADEATGALPADRSEPALLNRVTEAYPAWSPDGEWIAFMSTADGDFDVYVVAPALGERRQLTDAPDRDGTPAWSPHGSRIAFQSFRDGRSQIYVMAADGSGQRRLSDGSSHDEHPSWSADGERLLYASDRDATPESPGNIDVYEMRADGTGVRRITDTPEVETYPSWSPDGSRIAVRKIMPDGNWEVVVLDADGSNPRAVAPHPAADGWPVWSPDGRRLVFSSERAGSADLWLLDLQSEELRRLTWDDEADERQPWFSPDGRRVAYARYRWFPGEPFYEASEIMVLDVPAAAGRRDSARDAAASREGDAPRDGLIAAGDARLYYRVVGSSPDTVVVVHGGPGAGINSVFADFERLAGDLTLVFYDQRGGGRSTLPADTAQLRAEHFVRDLDAVRAHFGLERLRLLAHSFGAVLVARYAEEHPERLERLVLHGATGPVQAEAARAARAAASNPDTALARRSGELLGELLEGSAADPVETCRRWEEIGRRMTAAGGDETRWSGTVCEAPPEAVRYYFQHTAQRTPRTFGPWDFTDRLARVDAPVLVIAGDADSLGLAAQRAWADSYPNGEILVVPGPGKTAIADQPERVAPAVARFLATDD